MTSIDVRRRGGLAVARGDDPLLGFGRPGAHGFRVDLGGGFLERLLEQGDGLVHQGGLDLPLARDLELAQLALAADAGFVQSAFGGDARPLDLLAGLDLGFLQGLRARHLDLLQRTAACQPGRFDRLLAADLGLLDLLLRRDLGLLDVPVGLGALDLLAGELDGALLLGDLDHLLLVDLQHFAALLRGDARLLQLQLGGDAGPLDGIALPDLGSIERLGLGDGEASWSPARRRCGRQAQPSPARCGPPRRPRAP